MFVCSRVQVHAVLEGERPTYSSDIMVWHFYWKSRAHTQLPSILNVVRRTSPIHKRIRTYFCKWHYHGVARSVLAFFYTNYIIILLAWRFLFLACFLLFTLFLRFKSLFYPAIREEIMWERIILFFFLLLSSQGKCGMFMDAISDQFMALLSPQRKWLRFR